MNAALSIAYFDRLGMPVMFDLNFSNARCGPACGVLWQGCDPQGSLLTPIITDITAVWCDTQKHVGTSLIS